MTSNYVKAESGEGFGLAWHAGSQKCIFDPRRKDGTRHHYNYLDFYRVILVLALFFKIPFFCTARILLQSAVDILYQKVNES